MHPTRAGIGLVRLGDSDFVPQNPEDDVRGKDVYDTERQRIGSVGDLYIDRQEREVRFLEVGAGGFLGIGEKRYLVPVEAIVEVAEGWVAIEPGRTKRWMGPPPSRPRSRRRPPTTGARTTPRRRTAPARKPLIAEATPTPVLVRPPAVPVGWYACKPPVGRPVVPKPPTGEDTRMRCGGLGGLWTKTSCPTDPPNVA